MRKLLIVVACLLAIPSIGFSFAGGGMSGYGNFDDDNGSESANENTGEDDEEERVKEAIRRAQQENGLVMKVNDSGYMCLQSPSGRLYKEKTTTINSAVKHLNNDFGPSDSGARWYVVGC